jgi:hypothetical protein
MSFQIRFLLLFLFTAFNGLLYGQETARIVGTVTDSVNADQLPFVSVVVVVDNQQVSVAKTELDGSYDISVPADLKFDLVFMATGFPTRLIEGLR